MVIGWTTSTNQMNHCQYVAQEGWLVVHFWVEGQHWMYVAASCSQRHCCLSLNSCQSQSWWKPKHLLRGAACSTVSLCLCQGLEKRERVSRATKATSDWSLTRSVGKDFRLKIPRTRLACKCARSNFRILVESTDGEFISRIKKREKWLFWTLSDATMVAAKKELACNLLLWHFY